MDLSAPAGRPPPGQESNLVDPPSKAYLLILTVVVCLTFTTPAVWIRTYVSCFILRRVRWDDWLVLLCWLLFVAYSIEILIVLRYGLLTDIWNVSVRDFRMWIKLSYVEELLYSVLICGIKLAVLILYKRIFVPARQGNKWIWYTIIFVIIFNGLFYLANTFVVGFNCVPRQAIWDKSIPGKCVNVYAVIIGTAALNVVSDFFIIMIPTVVVWKLQVPRKRKIELSVIFGFGVSGFAFSVGRLIKSVSATKDHNQTVALAEVALWTFGEIASCFMACCVPMVPRFVNYLRAKRNSSTGTPTELSKPFAHTERTQQARPPTNTAPFWSLLASTLKTEHEEEDPYLMYERSFDRTPSDMSHVQTLNANDILVSRAVDISVVPKAPEDDRPNSFFP